ncbi:acyl dehydratase [Actinomadura sp. DC4]|uniref:acyl dehydratase n=1 Tax=Actinomadura sp. DC4 TaxID=3055069 RepID=UPI0025B06E1A|nr:acyl dehydratase [Actinomadura sp. DC4]MDN3353638.1 acyl dehydratase [Actinomadura sp. DC4]
MEHIRVEGPFLDELGKGQVFDAAPPVTLTYGGAAVHQSIVGDRLALALDEHLSRGVLGLPGFAHPALVWDVAIGQSTVATRQVMANLFYRGLVFRRAPVIGDTLRTVTRVEGLRRNRPRPDRPASGLAALRVTTVDQEDRPVLDFWRCAMLPVRDADRAGAPDDDMALIGRSEIDEAAAELVAGWDLAPLAARPGSPRLADLPPGTVLEIAAGDIVSSAPELARSTLNIAAVHHDAGAAGGERLVYGGHTIGLALAQAARALPTLVTVAGWRSCDHTGPVREGDTLRSTVEVEDLVRPLPNGLGLVRLRSTVHVADGHRQVLDWRLIAIVA